MDIVKERRTAALEMFYGLVIAVVLVLALIGLMESLFGASRSRCFRNRGACSEVCVTMDLRREERDDACWCGDDDHTIRVAPLSWEDGNGDQTGRVIPDTVEVKIAP